LRHFESRWNFDVRLSRDVAACDVTMWGGDVRWRNEKPGSSPTAGATISPGRLQESVAASDLRRRPVHLWWR